MHARLAQEPGIFTPSSLNSHLTWNEDEQSNWILCFGEDIVNANARVTRLPNVKEKRLQFQYFNIFFQPRHLAQLAANL